LVSPNSGSGVQSNEKKKSRTSRVQGSFGIRFSGGWKSNHRIIQKEEEPIFSAKNIPDE
jgi:hypothetical protein